MRHQRRQTSATIICCIILFFCPIHPLFALTHDQLIQYYNKGDYSTLITEFKSSDSGKYGINQLYLYFKSLLNIGDFHHAEIVLSMIEDKADWGLQPMLMAEKLNLYSKKASKKELRRLFNNWPPEQNSPYLRDRIKTVLKQFDPDVLAKTALKRPLQKLLITLPELNEEPEILRILLSQLKPKDERRKALRAVIWVYSDISKITKQSQIDTGFVKADLRKYKSLVLEHFKKQKKYGNHNYINAEISVYMTPMRSIDAETFKELSQIYFRSMTRKRQYSRLIGLIGSEKGRRYFNLSLIEALKMEFNLWLKKGHSQKCIKVLRQLKKIDQRLDLNEFYLKLADFYFSHDKYKKSLLYYDRVRLSKLSKVQISDARWNQFLIHHKFNNKSELKKIAAWTDKFKFEIPGNAAKFCYWGCKLKLYKNRDPVVCYQQYPYTYYGLKALHMTRRSSESRSTEIVFKKRKSWEKIARRDKRIVHFVSMLYLIREVELADALVVHYMLKNNKFRNTLVF